MEFDSLGGNTGAALGKKLISNFLGGIRPPRPSISGRPGASKIVKIIKKSFINPSILEAAGRPEMGGLGGH